MLIPPEILCEIFKHLDSRGLSSAKLTCKMFYNATRSRQFWYQLVESCESICGGSKINESMERLTIPDLERWVVRRLRAYESWFSDSPLTLRVHQPRRTKVEIDTPRLLPGGRWLLTSTPHGQYFIYDLDSPHTEPQLLFDPGQYDEEDGTLDKLTSYSTWINPSGETLSFRAVVWRQGKPPEGHVTRTQIYEATLDEDGRTFLPTGTPLYTLRTYGNNRSRIEISDKYLVEIWTVRNEGGFQPVLFVRWYSTDEEHSSRRDVRAELVTTGILPHMQITPNDLIVVAGRDFIEIYAISQLQNFKPQEKLSPLHRLHFSYISRVSHLAQPFLHQNLLWVVFIIGGKEIRAMQLPQNSVDHPLEATLGCHSQDWGRPGVPASVNSTATASLHDQTIDILTYSWDKELTNSHLYAHSFQLPNLHEHHWMDFIIEGVDAASGRIFLLHHSENSYVILDTK